MTTIPERKTTSLPWFDGDAEIADSYRGGGRKAAIAQNLNGLADGLAAIIGLSPKTRYLGKSSYDYQLTLAASARAGYAFSGPVGAVGRALVEGVPLTALGMVAGAFGAVKDAVDIVGHAVAAALERK